MRLRCSLLVIAILTVGCSGSGGEARPDGVQPGFIVWTEPIDEGLDGIVSGVVQIESDGCVFLSSSDDSARKPAIWPFATRFDGTAIRAADGLDIRDGDFVRGSGGEVGEFEHEYFFDNTTLSEDIELLRDCGGIDDDRILVFNATQPITVQTEE